MTPRELYDWMERQIPETLSCDWDNDGLLCCPNPGRRVRRALITLDITGQVVDYAIRHGYDTIVSHHPLIFRPLKRLDDPKLMAMIQHDIAALCFHTRLDRVAGGVNDTLASYFSLREVSPFGEDDMGRIGLLPFDMTGGELAEKSAAVLNSDRVLYTGGQKLCRRLAVLGGSGKDYLRAAKEAGADAFLTGELSYHDMMDAEEENFTVITAGHYETEQPICAVLEEEIRRADDAIFTEIVHSQQIAHMEYQ